MHRHFVNDPRNLVDEALEGFELANPSLIRWNRDPSFVVRAHPGETPKVALLAGGGSGHEPLHTGFVGTGMLDAAVPGGVFASPAAFQVEGASRAIDRGQGVVYIVKNYTGDVVNFSMAAELVGDDGIEVHTVLVDDDLATESDSGGPGRRGTAAVVAVEKVCGAAAERGAPIQEVAELGRRVAAGSRSLAVAFSAGTHPGESEPSFVLGDDEVEFGVGIHGERGIGRRPFAPAADLARSLTEPLLEAIEPATGGLIVIVNGLGSTHLLELFTMYREVRHVLDAAGVEVARALVGPYVTSLDMAGCSVTLVRTDPEIVELWDDPVRTPALTW
jgi:dihydroxyacetone kinase-like protein